MEITIELIEKVLDATNADYKIVKQALIDAEGDADAAIAAIKETEVQAEKKAAEETAAQTEDGTTDQASAADDDSQTQEGADDQKNADEFDWTIDWTTDQFADDMVEKLKKRVKEGNVDHIVITKDDKTLIDIPVNVGIVGGLLGIALVPWALIFGALAAYGLNCKVKIVTSDGKDEEL